MLMAIITRIMPKTLKRTSPKKDKKPIISSVSEEENKGSEETDPLKDSFSQKEQNPAGNDGSSVYFSDNNEYNSSISSEENGSDGAEERKMAGSEVQSSSVFMPAKGGVVVYNDIKEYCDKLNETNSDEKIPVRIDVYWGGELITDQAVLNDEKIRLEEAGLYSEIKQEEERFILVADLTAEELQKFPGSEQNGYILRLYTD